MIWNDLPKSHVLSSELKTERVREDASGDREDGEEDDDELPCVTTNRRNMHHCPALYGCEIPWERVPYLSALKVCLRQGAIQIYIYLYLYLRYSGTGYKTADFTYLFTYSWRLYL